MVGQRRGFMRWFNRQNLQALEAEAVSGCHAMLLCGALRTDSVLLQCAPAMAAHRE
jgi:hypothetical protein